MGSKGLLGAELARLGGRDGHKIFAFDKDGLDITDEAAIEEFFKTHSPKVVINCAVVSPKACEENPGRAYQVNVEGVKNLLKHKSSALLIQFSSPAVFDGNLPLQNIQYSDSPEVGYKENDQVNAISVYGKTKAEMEKLLNGTDNLILRTSWVYSKTKPFGLADAPPFPLNEIGRPTYTEDIWKCINVLWLEKLTGLFHVCGPEVMSRHEQAMRLFGNVEPYSLPKDNIRPLSIGKIYPYLVKNSVSLTKWG